MTIAMSINYTGDPLANEQIREFARRLRGYHSLAEGDVPNVIEILGRRGIFTRFGDKHFEYQVVADEELGGDEALTLITTSHVRVRVSKTTFARASSLDRRARMTIAHELGHGVLHRNSAPLARSRVDAVQRFVPHPVSVERQAGVFASAYLITYKMISEVSSASELAQRALVSEAAADIAWEQNLRERERGLLQARFRELATELGAVGKAETPGANSLQCPICGERTLIPLTGRYICHGSCNRAYDSFPDGDGPEWPLSS